MQMQLTDIKLEGWCSPEKEKWLTDWIEARRPKLIVEIGVYGGASLIPMAVAAASYPSRVYGIDPWEIAACLEGMVDRTSVEWWTHPNQIPLSKLENDCRKAVRDLNLTNVQFLKGHSDLFADAFDDNSIDLLSIDGNHGPQALIDGQNYLRKVKRGGLIACDDEDWTEGGVKTVRLLVKWLLKNGCKSRGTITDCAMIQKL